MPESRIGRHQLYSWDDFSKTARHGESPAVVKVLADVAPLRDIDFRRLWVDDLVTVVGAQPSVVAVPQQIYQSTGSSGYVDLAGIFGLVPLLVFGLWGGAGADVMGRRTLLLITSTGAALTSVAFWLQA